MHTKKPSLTRRSAMQGLTLLELMVGLAIGLIVSIAAAGSLVYMQSSGRAVNEATRLQQDATLAFDTIGRFVRSSGSVGLVAVNEESVSFTPSTSYSALGPSGHAFEGLGPSSFRTAHPSGPDGLNFDCLGNGPLAAGTLITEFSLSNGRLLCSVNGVQHVLIDGVEQITMHYGVRDAANNIQYRNFSSSIPWADVQSLRLCIVMMSHTPVSDFADLFKGSSNIPYADCNGVNIASRIAADNLLRRRYTQVFVMRPGGQ